MSRRLRLFPVISCVGILAGAPLGYSEQGKWGIGGAIGAASPVGSDAVRHNGTTGVALGAHLSYEATPQLSTEVSYDNLYLGHGQRIEPIIFSGVFHRKIEEGLDPFLQLGAGVGRGIHDANYDHLSLKAGIGLIYPIGNSLSVGPQVIIHYADSGAVDRSAYSLTPGIFATYHFRLIQTQA